MCTLGSLPTCRGIPGDDIRPKKYFPTGSLFFEFTHFEIHPQPPASRPGMAYQDATHLRHVMCVSDEMFIALIFYVLTRIDMCVFMHLYFFPKKTIWKFVNSKKNTSDWKIFFCECHRLEYCDTQVGRVQI